MRAFDNNDELATRRYTATGHTGWPVVGQDVPYSTVSENFTQIDRVKLGADLNETNKLYGFMYVGDTHNDFRDTTRFFNGLDFRWTNRDIDGLLITGYGKRNNESGELPTTFPEAPLVQGGDTVADYHHPLNYEKSAAGLKGQWRPWASGWPAARGLAFTGGYEYNRIDRKFADYEFDDGRYTPADTFIFEQPGTDIHLFHVGTSMRWSCALETYARYKHYNLEDPIYGFRATSGDINTNQPNQEEVVELGFTWTPTDTFLVTATFGIDNRWHHSLHDNPSRAYTTFLTNPRETDFDETSYPITVSAWYALNSKWSLTGGYASYTNWIDQLITLGD